MVYIYILFFVIFFVRYYLCVNTSVLRIFSLISLSISRSLYCVCVCVSRLSFVHSVFFYFSAMRFCLHYFQCVCCCLPSTLVPLFALPLSIILIHFCIQPVVLRSLLKISPIECVRWTPLLPYSTFFMITLLNYDINCRSYYAILQIRETILFSPCFFPPAPYLPSIVFIEFFVLRSKPHVCVCIRCFCYSYDSFLSRSHLVVRFYLI